MTCMEGIPVVAARLATETAVPAPLTARYVLGTGNGQEPIANPHQVWLVKARRGVLNGVDVGPAGPLPEHARRNEFLIPERPRYPRR